MVMFAWSCNHRCHNRNNSLQLSQNRLDFDRNYFWRHRWSYALGFHQLLDDLEVISPSSNISRHIRIIRRYLRFYRREENAYIRYFNDWVIYFHARMVAYFQWVCW